MHKGYKWTEKSKQKLREYRIGKHHTEITKSKIGQRQLGRRLGKTFEKIYGFKKANQIKEKISTRRTYFFKIHPEVVEKWRVAQLTSVSGKSNIFQGLDESEQ